MTGITGIRKPTHVGNLSRSHFHSDTGLGKSNPGKYQKGVNQKSDKEAAKFGQQILGDDARLEERRTRLQQKLQLKREQEFTRLLKGSQTKTTETAIAIADDPVTQTALVVMALVHPGERVNISPAVAGGIGIVAGVTLGVLAGSLTPPIA